MIEDIVIFFYFQNNDILTSWIVRISNFSYPIRLGAALCIRVPNLIKTGQTVTEIKQLIISLKMAAVIYGSHYATTHEDYWRCYRCAKFGQNHCSSSDNIKA